MEPKYQVTGFLKITAIPVSYKNENSQSVYLKYSLLRSTVFTLSHGRFLKHLPQKEVSGTATPIPQPSQSRIQHRGPGRVQARKTGFYHPPFFCSLTWEGGEVGRQGQPRTVHTT